MAQNSNYSNILEEVFNNVKDLKRGVLFTCVEIMAPADADEIIDHFSISLSASFYDDLQVLIQAPSFQPVLKRIDPMNIRNVTLIGLAKKPMDWTPSLSVGIIFVSALVIVSLWNLLQRDDMNSIPIIKNLCNRIRGRSQNSDTEENNSMAPQYEERQADLCLVIPCKRIKPSLQEHLRSDKSLLSTQAASLVDASAYFLATESKGKDISNVNLNDGWGNFPEDSDLLVQLHISDGNDLIGADLKRSLSRAISVKEEITIKKIGLLNDLNNLREFHRA